MKKGNPAGTFLPAIVAMVFMVFISCATYIPNGPYSSDPQLQGKTYEVLGSIKPVRLDRAMMDDGLKSVLLEKARAEYGESVDDVIDIKSITLSGTTFLLLFPLPGRTVFEAVAIKYTTE
ncbi:hypothetical protein P0082_08530 [Candidatus Haliotispira prima]|uniref:Uncharacterized protein n=1 Tax=Candidatus Haliotispira prima TaxID=3034016 RepID=A0ABY8MF46_9SPIO|nr:hypothetical protein P0082_08530 [Candidatus Haliotispira prima]